MKPDPHVAPAAAIPRRAVFGLLVFAALALYAAGLTRDLTEPWVGMHDWNGAFFSQLARNFLRYPFETHAGMPIVHTGATPPTSDTGAIYATHPPGLVALVAGGFLLLGESAAAARLLPIVCSLLSLVLLIHLVARGFGRLPAIAAGVLYAVMPMSVYFGRMVNHEPVVTLCILGAAAAWTALPVARRRRRNLVALLAALTGMIWVDWSGVLFAAVFAVVALWQGRRDRAQRREARLIAAWVAAMSLAMVAHLVYAGLDGRWLDLHAIFTSRSVETGGAGAQRETSVPGGPATYFIENVTWPIAALAAVGLIVQVRRRIRPARAAPPHADRAGLCIAIIAATALIWTLVFWRQYIRHNYWLFYAGPPVAAWAGLGVSGLSQMIGGARTGAGRWTLYACLSICCAIGLRGVDDYFLRRGFLEDEIRGWIGIRERTRPDERVLLLRNPYRVEQRGGYTFRNIVPPQIAWYLDRPIDVAASIDDVVARHRSVGAFVLPVQDAVRFGPVLQPLRALGRDEQVGSLVMFDFDAAEPRPTPAPP